MALETLIKSLIPVILLEMLSNLNLINFKILWEVIIVVMKLVILDHKNHPSNINLFYHSLDHIIHFPLEVFLIKVSY
jgi:hypothetical protein